MVILPFYQILIASAVGNRTDYAVLMKDGRSTAVDIALRYPSYNADGKNICGIIEKENKDLIGLTRLNLSKPETAALFTLSDKSILYPTISPDNQKIAFIAQDDVSGQSVLRVIVHEEFGWFPMPFVKLAASADPICFSTPETLIYTDDSGVLKAALLSKRPKTVTMAEKGKMPAYHALAKLTAYVCGRKIIVSGQIKTEIETDGVTALRFSNEGNALLFAQGNLLRRYTFDTQNIETVFDSPNPIIFAAEI